MHTPVRTTLKRLQDASGWAGGMAGSQVLPLIFALWMVAFGLKHIGASWDLAWHFRYIRDDLIPPHIVNLSGNALALAIMLVQLRTRIATERRGFLLLQAGFAVFLIALPLDLLNHRLFGLDVTIWSIPHLMFFGGSTLALLGLLSMWRQLAPPGRWKSACTLFFLILLLDCAIFVLGQQEYGVLTIDSYLHGRATASSELLQLARGNVVGFAHGYIPDWIYPVWLVLTSAAVFVYARRVQPGRWTATLVAICYLLYRAIASLLLVAASFPPSFIPVMLLGAAVVFDLGARWRPAVATTALLIAYYGGAAFVGRVMLMPEFALWTAPLVAVPLFVMIHHRDHKEPRELTHDHVDF